MSQIISMANRLQEAEQTILQLRKDLERGSSPLYNQTALANTTASPEHEVQPQHREDIAQHRVHIPLNESTSEELLSDLSLDEHGKVSIYDILLIHWCRADLSRYHTTAQPLLFMNLQHWTLLLRISRQVTKCPTR
jgi:hypothetical protein